MVRFTCIYFLSLLSFMSSSKNVDLMVCLCVPAAIQLLWMGFFPCAPLGLTLAISLPVLSLVRKLFTCTPLNISAWSKSLEAYLGGMGYEVDTKILADMFYRRVYEVCILEISLEEYIQQYLQSSAASPSGLCPPTSSLQDPTVSSSKKWPSEYLQKCCPLCFGGRNWQSNNSSDIDAIVCIDACFTQKQRSGLQDDPVNPTATVFLSQEEVDSMECEVASLRKKKPSMQRRSGYGSRRNHRDEEDEYELGMRIPTSVLKSCNESFTAADEKHQKASTQFFSDTGVMALLCHHDHVIHLANMTSAGEKQHYALALIKSLFSHLPDDFILAYYMTYEGFGLSDGEGCECFRSSIKALIPSLCVSGFHQCLFVIDFQVHHLDEKSLTGLGHWLLQWWNHCQAKKASVSKGLRKCGVDTMTLQAEWVAQVALRTKAIPHKLITGHSAKATENIILQIMATQKSLENFETRLGELERDLLHGASDMTSLNIQLAECHQKVRCFKQALQKQKAALGVNGLVDLATLQSNSYLQLERLEHSYQQTVSEQRLQNHTETSVKQHEPGVVKLSTNYNNMCLQMAALIHQGKAPQGSIAPVLIPRDALFKLDVDDDIWQDAGLEDDTGRLPPAWLADEKLGYCEEEERCLLHERRTLMEWELRGFPRLPDESWGVTNEELNSKVLISQLLATDGNEMESLDDLEFEDEEELEMLDDELLCVAEEFALADEYHQQSILDEEFFVKNIVRYASQVVMGVPTCPKRDVWDVPSALG
ncbi:hypothetical protein EV401DRAFT_2062187 [Pisolithus croceorrhizus]|nr:hypothetical protein EV401DRAFT_2062187 [Pisolithus croceorrhizus]